MHFREEGPVNSGMDSICVDVGCTAQPAPAVWNNWCSSRVEIRQAPFVFHFLFSFFLNNILSKNKDFFFPPWSLLEPLICSRIKYSFETSVLCQVKTGMTQDRYVLGEWGLIMIGISYLICTPDGENGLRLDWEISLSNEKGGMNLYCPRSKLWPQLTRTRFYPLAWREKINSLEAVPPLCV